MGIRLTPLEEEILRDLRVSDVKHLAESKKMTEGTINVHLYRIRKKYKDARKFVDKIDTLRRDNPNIRKYLKTRETK